MEGAALAAAQLKFIWKKSGLKIQKFKIAKEPAITEVGSGSTSTKSSPTSSTTKTSQKRRNLEDMHAFLEAAVSTKRRKPLPAPEQPSVESLLLPKTSSKPARAGPSSTPVAFLCNLQAATHKTGKMLVKINTQKKPSTSRMTSAVNLTEDDPTDDLTEIGRGERVDMLKTRPELAILRFAARESLARNV